MRISVMPNACFGGSRTVISMPNGFQADDAMQANLQAARDQQARAKVEFGAALSQIQTRYGV
jgi:hypothetical protein